MPSTGEPSRYKMTLAELEHNVRVPRSDQVEENVQDVAPPKSLELSEGLRLARQVGFG